MTPHGQTEGPAPAAPAELYQSTEKFSCDQAKDFSASFVSSRECPEISGRIGLWVGLPWQW
jgi:hypothetical protein